MTRRSARALLLDDDARLVLIKRTKVGQPPYWTAPGGGVEPGEYPVDALGRELGEELGAAAWIGGRVLLISTPSDTGETVSVQEIFVARLDTLRPAARTGAEWRDPSRGGYEVERHDITGIGDIDVKPAVLRDFVVANADALVAEAALLR
ncbi:NUDIX domain-containing protein [Amycolatopsis sp. NPDC004378]